MDCQLNRGTALSLRLVLQGKINMDLDNIAKAAEPIPTAHPGIDINPHCKRTDLVKLKDMVNNVNRVGKDEKSLTELFLFAFDNRIFVDTNGDQITIADGERDNVLDKLGGALPEMMLMDIGWMGNEQLSKKASSMAELLELGSLAKDLNSQAT